MRTPWRKIKEKKKEGKTEFGGSSSRRDGNKRKVWKSAACHDAYSNGEQGRQPRITAFQRDLCSYIPCVGALSMILRMAFVSFRLGIIHCYTGNKPAAFILECFLDIATRPFVDRRLFSKYTHGRVKSNRLIWIKKRIACPPWSRLPKYNTLLILDLISWNYRFLFLFLLFQIIGNLINFLPYYFTGIISLTILSTKIILSILNSTASDRI